MLAFPLRAYRVVGGATTTLCSPLRATDSESDAPSAPVRVATPTTPRPTGAVQHSADAARRTAVVLDRVDAADVLRTAERGHRGRRRRHRWRDRRRVHRLGGRADRTHRRAAGGGPDRGGG